MLFLLIRGYMNHSKFSYFLFVILITLFLSGCNWTNDVQISEISKETTAYDETIRLNNCGGKAQVKQTAQRSFATTIEATAQVKAGYDKIVEGNISSKYGQYRDYTKSLELIAPAGTNMEFDLKWSEEVHAGNLTVGGEQSTYKVYIPLSVDLVSSNDLGCTNSNQNTTNPSGTTSEFLPEATIIYEDNFDSSTLSNWHNYKINTVTGNGTLTLNGQSTWEGVISQERTLGTNQAALIEFSYTSGSEFKAELSTGDFQAPSWRVWGIFGRNNNYDTNVSFGSQTINSNRWLGNLVSSPNHWYIAMFKIGASGEFTTKIWDRDNPNQYIEIDQTLNSDWANRSWNFTMDIYIGNLIIDKYQQVSFK